MFKSAGQSSVDCPALLFSVYFHLVFIPINLFSPCVPSPMSILICSVTCYSLASRSFWTFLLLFSALCPFSPARFRLSLWLPENFGLIYCFSVLYVHFLLPDSVFLSGFKSSPNLCVHSSSSYVSPSMLPLSSGDLIEWSLVCHSTLSYQKFCDRHSNHYDHPEELHQSVE